jgi:hypothetical protein
MCVHKPNHSEHFRSRVSLVVSDDRVRRGPTGLERKRGAQRTAPNTLFFSCVATGHWLGPWRRQVGPGLAFLRCARGSSSCTPRPGPRFFLVTGAEGCGTRRAVDWPSGVSLGLTRITNPGPGCSCTKRSDTSVRESERPGAGVPKTLSTRSPAAMSADPPSSHPSH